jgi:arginase
VSAHPVRVIRMPYIGERNAPDRSPAPAEIDDAALHEAMAGAGIEVIAPTATVELSGGDAKQYGAWQRVALANARLGRIVEAALRKDEMPVGLLANCNALPGMLAGVQRALDGRGDVGLIWIDAHADFNTPETTLSGMLGGMPVALSAGLCLHRMRGIAGMTRPIDPRNILMCGLRDVDPLERALLDEHGVAEIGTEALIAAGGELFAAVEALAGRVEAIYVHVDMDVLDPDEVPGHGLTVPGGPTSEQLAPALAAIFHCRAVRALGVASTPPSERDAGGRARAAAQRLIVAAVGAK